LCAFFIRWAARATEKPKFCKKFGKINEKQKKTTPSRENTQNTEAHFLSRRRLIGHTWSGDTEMKRRMAANKQKKEKCGNKMKIKPNRRI
jgi:hypothetical protein